MIGRGLWITFERKKRQPCSGWRFFGGGQILVTDRFRSGYLHEIAEEGHHAVMTPIHIHNRNRETTAVPVQMQQLLVTEDLQILRSILVCELRAIGVEAPTDTRSGNSIARVIAEFVVALSSCNIRSTDNQSAERQL